jgi:small subunit ribosomal protein S4
LFDTRKLAGINAPLFSAGPIHGTAAFFFRETDRLAMTKRVNAKFKIARRLGVNLWGRAKTPNTDQGPGQHGARRKKPSNFGTQLRAKQRLKGYYGNITERQFRKIYAEAARRRGDTGENLIELLERRLDAVVYRMKFAASPFQARQLVNHAHIRVNGKKVNIASYVVDDGDTIEIKQKSKELATILAAQASNERQVPDYLNVDEKALKGTFVRAPKLGDVPYPVQMEPNLVVEYYSR